MPIARIGYGTDFILENQGVGIATDTTDIKLVIGNEGTTKACLLYTSDAADEG